MVKNKCAPELLHFKVPSINFSRAWLSSLSVAWLAFGLNVICCPSAHAKSKDLAPDEMADRFVYDGVIACNNKKYNKCASLATRALAHKPDDEEAGKLLAIAKRRGGKPSTPRKNPGFQHDTGRVSLSGWYGGFGNHPKEASAELYIGSRFLGRYLILQAMGGLVVGRFSPFRETASTSAGGGVGVRFTGGAAIPINRVAAIELLAAPGFRYLRTMRENYIFLDFDFGPSVQYGRLSFNLMARVSGADIVDPETESNFEGPIWGLSWGIALAL